MHRDRGLRPEYTKCALITLWSRQICVLDEPSNFLDREALGGLAVAIRDWAGAVVRDFVSCPLTTSLLTLILCR